MAGSEKAQVRRRRPGRALLLMGALGAVVGLSVAAISWACTTPEGQTFYADGTDPGTGKTGVHLGDRITMYATGAQLGTAYQLVIGENGPHPTHACMVTDYTVNNTTRYANADHYIGNVSGPAGTPGLGISGLYQVCFTDYLNKNTSTAAAAITFI